MTASQSIPMASALLIIMERALRVAASKKGLKEKRLSTARMSSGFPGGWESGGTLAALGNRALQQHQTGDAINPFNDVELEESGTYESVHPLTEPRRTIAPSVRGTVSQGIVLGSLKTDA